MTILTLFNSILKSPQVQFFKKFHTRRVRLAIKNGFLEGQVCHIETGGRYYEFLGIPYAKPPVGKLRFKPPEPIESWTGVLNATKEGNVCPQKHFITGKCVGNEDCLYLNVYTPDTNPAVKKAVMILVHGGSFINGSGGKELYHPQYFLQDDVIVVTFNYRIGAFGFLSLQNEDIPGNAGVQDQLAVMKWVKENIHNFGGDANNITCFGQSAGSACIQTLLMLPSSKGLVNKAILQSGCSVSGWANRSGRKVSLLGQLLGSSSDVKDMYKVFMKTNPESFMKNYSKVFTKDDKTRGMPMLFGAVVENYKDHERALIVRPPKELLWQGKYPKIPTMMGYNNSEGLTTVMLLKRIETLDKDFGNLIPRSLRLVPGSEKEKFISNLIRIFFFGNKPVSRETFPELTSLLTDYYFRNDASYTLRILTALSDSPLYFYRFSYGGRLNLYKNLYAPNSGISGATHGDEMSYLFKNIYEPKVSEDTEEELTRRRMVRMWTNFAKTGQPTPNPNDPLIGTYWPSAQEGKLSFMDINKDLKVCVNPDGDRTAFWDTIYEISKGTSLNEKLKHIKQHKQ